MVLAASGCGAEPPDYQSIWSTTPSTTAPPHRRAEAPVPIGKYLENAGVTGEPVAPRQAHRPDGDDAAAAGLAAVRNPNLAPGTQMIAKGDTYPTAMLIVFKLDGDFDVNEALKHAYADAELSRELQAAQRLHRRLPRISRRR